MLEAYKCNLDTPPLEQARIATVAIEKVTSLLYQGREAVDFYERCFADPTDYVPSRTTNFDAALHADPAALDRSRRATLGVLREQISQGLGAVRFLSCMQQNLSPTDARALKNGLEAACFILPHYVQDMYARSLEFVDEAKRGTLWERIRMAGEPMITRCTAALCCLRFRNIIFREIAPVGVLVDHMKAALE